MSNWKLQAAQSERDLKEFINQLHKDTIQKLYGIKLATLWYRKSSKNGVWFWEFNHIEDGHCQNDHPTPKVPAHNQVWKGGTWAKSYIQLSGKNNIVDHYLIY